jgi:hypothetical protein
MQSQCNDQQQLNLLLREENVRLRGLLEAEQAQTAALLPQASDLPLLQQLLCATDGDEGGREDSQPLAQAYEDLQALIVQERLRAQALKQSLLAIRHEAQRVNVVCVELHAAILSGRL